MIGRELFLDTKGACFLCLKESFPTTCSNGLKEFCLRTICRFLKISPASILVKSLSGHSILNDEQEKEEIFQMDKCDFSVLLCAACSSISGKLAELIQQIEMIQLLTTHQLQAFYQIISTSELDQKSNSLRNNLKEKLQSASVSSVETCFIETLRLAAKEKSSIKLRNLRSTSSPKVVLNRLDSNKRKISSNSNTPEEARASDCFISPEISPILGNRNQTKISFTNPNVENVSLPSSNLPKPLQLEDDNKPLIRSEKLDNNSSSNFQTQNLGDISLLPTTEETSSPGMSSNLSSVASVDFGFPSVQTSNILPSTPYHLGHTNETANNVNSQRSKDNIEKVDAIFEKNCKFLFSGSHYQCHACKQDNPMGELEAWRHLIDKHPEKLFISSKLPHVSVQYFSGVCKEMFILETKGGIENTKAVLPPTPASKYLCKYCNQYYSNIDQFQYHLVLRHYSQLEEKVKCLQEQISCNPVPPVSRMDTGHPVGNLIGVQQDHSWNRNNTNTNIVYSQVPSNISHTVTGFSSGGEALWNSTPINGVSGHHFGTLATSFHQPQTGNCQEFYLLPWNSHTTLLPNIPANQMVTQYSAQDGLPKSCTLRISQSAEFRPPNLSINSAQPEERVQSNEIPHHSQSTANSQISQFPEPVPPPLRSSFNDTNKFVKEVCRVYKMKL